MEDDSERVAVTRAQLADTVAMLDAVHPAGPGDRAIADWKDDGVALSERDHSGARLASRPLLSEDEFAAFETGRVRQQDRDLERKQMLAVHVLVQAIVVAGTVAEDQRRRARLPCRVALVDPLFEVDYYALAAQPVEEVRDLLHVPPKSAAAVEGGSAGVFDLAGMSEYQRQVVAQRRGENS